MAVGSNAESFKATTTVVDTLTTEGVLTTAPGTPSAKEDKIKFLRDIANPDAVNIQIIFDETQLKGAKVETFNLWKAEYKPDNADFADFDAFKK